MELNSVYSCFEKGRRADKSVKPMSSLGILWNFCIGVDEIHKFEFLLVKYLQGYTRCIKTHNTVCQWLLFFMLHRSWKFFWNCAAKNTLVSQAWLNSYSSSTRANFRICRRHFHASTTTFLETAAYVSVHYNPVMLVHGVSQATDLPILRQRIVLFFARVVCPQLFAHLVNVNIYIDHATKQPRPLIGLLSCSPKLFFSPSLDVRWS